MLRDLSVSEAADNLFPFLAFFAVPIGAFLVKFSPYVLGVLVRDGFGDGDSDGSSAVDGRDVGWILLILTFLPLLAFMFMARDHLAVVMAARHGWAALAIFIVMVMAIMLLLLEIMHRQNEPYTDLTTGLDAVKAKTEDLRYARLLLTLRVSCAVWAVAIVVAVVWLWEIAGGKA